MTTLMNERNAIGGGSSIRGSGSIGSALRLWREREDLRTPALRARLLELFVRADAARLTGDRQRVEQGDRRRRGGSIGKLTGAELNQDVYEFCMDMLGPDAALYSGYDAVPSGGGEDLARAFLRSRANTIEGGTSEVLRNVIGERLLGLPGDLRVDTGSRGARCPVADLAGGGAVLEFEFTEEQRALRDLAGSVAERTWTDDAVRAQLKTSAGFDREVWRTLGRDLGVLGLALPTESGEAVGGVVDLAIVAEEFGRVLAGVPLLGCVALAGTVLARSGDAAGLVPKIVSGETVVSLVATDARGAWAPERTGIIADGPVLCGEASHVLDAVAADAFVAVAQAEGRPSLFLVDAGAQGLAVEPLTTLDQTRRLGRVRFDGTPAQLLGEAGTSALDAVSAARTSARSSSRPKPPGPAPGCWR